MILYLNNCNYIIKKEKNRLNFIVQDYHHGITDKYLFNNLFRILRRPKVNKK